MGVDDSFIAWLTTSLEFFVGIGFFSETDMSPSGAVFQKIIANRSAIDTSLGPAFNDLVVVSYDEKRVLDRNAEYEVGNGNDAYIEFIQELVHISRGMFNPVGIKEHWETDNGPIKVEFSVENVEFTIWPEFNYDWLDLEIIDLINDTLPEVGVRFEIHETTTTDFYVIALTKKERSILENDRGWRFYHWQK